MRLIIILFILLSAFGLHAQVEEIPLTRNISLRNSDVVNGKTSIYFPVNTQRSITYVCIFPGGTKEISIDTSGYGSDCLVNIKKTPVNGSLQLTEKTKVSYTANLTPVLLLDTFSIEICNADTTNCDELFYYYAIERASSKFIQNSLVVQEETKTESIIPLDQVPSPVVKFHINGNVTGSKAVAYLEKPDKFIFYSGRGGLENVYNIVACDNFCVCDTFVYNVSVKSDTLDLPVMDDFSYSCPYPDPKIWINDDVYVNNTFAIKPPSIGVATFDGINSEGNPYLGGHGVSDHLTSRQIDLSKYVPFDNVYLSFFVEPKGYGNIPEDIDTLSLEFKDQNGFWNPIQTFVPGFPLQTDSFLFQAISITDLKYLFKGFQFRFVNKSDNTGMLDNWHIDYVSLNSGVIPSENTADIAFSQQPAGLLKSYTAMPWRQFESFEDTELNLSGNNLNLSIDLHNFFNKVETADPSNLKIYEISTGKNVVNNLTLLELPPLAPVDQRNLDPGFHHFDATKNLPGFLNQIKDDFNGSNGYRFVTEYTVNNSSESNLPVVKRNNKVSRETDLTYYYAYDDGIAESNIAVKKNGSRAAVKFHANVGDTLRAIQIAIPRVFNDVTKQLFNLLVWKDDLNTTPIHSDLLVKPFYPDKLFDTLQAFTTYVLMDEALTKEQPVYIPPGDFYIGWQQATDDEFPVTVGFDKNNPQAAKNSFVSLSAGWQTLESVNFNGAIMIRPVMGDIKINHTPGLVNTKDYKNSRYFISPNPVSTSLNIFSNSEIKPFIQAHIFNIQGKLLKSTSNDFQIKVDDLLPGMYFLKITDGQNNQPEVLKFIVSK